MKKHVALLSMLSCVLSVAIAACGSAAQPPPRQPNWREPAGALRVKSCIVESVRARCGTLTVYENRLTGKGRTIPIRFVVLLAYGRPRLPDPIVDFAGGPGSSAVDDDVPGVTAELTNLGVNRDLVFIDQRGTGGSNGLSCPSPPSLVNRAKLRASIEACLASLRGTADLQFYTSKMAAEDVAQVLTALHYGTVNLFGASYGATAAQVFQRLYPARVRTMTLLSGSLLDIPMLESWPEDSQQALDQLFTRCASDPVCSVKFPRLAADWAQLRAAKWVNDAVLGDEMHELLMSADTAAYVPLVIESALATKGNKAALTVLARQMTDVGLNTGSGASQAVISYPIECAEPWARLSAAEITDPASYYFQDSMSGARWWQYVCTLIPTSRAASDYGLARVTDTPVLMINGTADPQDPPANMAGAERIWPNSLEVVELGQSHSIDINAWNQCDSALVRAFVETASVKGLDTGCLAQVTLPQFAVSW